MGDSKFEEAQLKLERNRYYFDIIRFVALVLGSIFIFLLINFPESVFNKSKTREELKREKVRLILDALKLPDLLDRSEAILMIMDYYPAYDGDDSVDSPVLLADIYRLRYEKMYWKRRLKEAKDEDLIRIYRSNVEIVDKKIEDFIVKNVNIHKIGG